MAITYPHSRPPNYPVGSYPGGTEGYQCPSPKYAVGSYPGGTEGHNCPSPTYTTSLSGMSMPAQRVGGTLSTKSIHASIDADSGTQNKNV